MGRQQEAIECYVFAMGASPRDERRCHLHRSLCITIGNSNNYVQQQQPRHDRQQHRSGLDGQHGKVSYRNETDCLMSLLSDGGAHCSAVDSAAARLQLGVALLCQEWDVREAWSQVVASTKLRTASAVGGQEGGTTLQLNGRISGFAGTNLGWGAVWLIEVGGRCWCAYGPQFLFLTLTLFP